MYIVTGAAGFIGSNIVKELNNRGIDDIIAVDEMTVGDKVLPTCSHRGALSEQDTTTPS